MAKCNLKRYTLLNILKGKEHVREVMKYTQMMKERAGMFIGQDIVSK